MENILVISAVEPQKKKKNRYNIYTDGEYTASLGAETCVVYGIKVGKQIDEDELKAAILSDNTKYAFDCAVSLLSHKMRTSNELLIKLTDRGIDEDAVSDAIEKLKSYGYVDDASYAKEFVESAMLAGRNGKKVVAYKLKTKGIDDDIIEEALCLYTYEQEKKNAKDNLLVLNKRYQSDDAPKRRRKTFAALSRHGYDYEIINTILNEEED